MTPTYTQDAFHLSDMPNDTCVGHSIGRIRTCSREQRPRRAGKRRDMGAQGQHVGNMEAYERVGQAGQLPVDRSSIYSPSTKHTDRTTVYCLDNDQAQPASEAPTPTPALDMTACPGSCTTPCRHHERTVEEPPTQRPSRRYPLGSSQGRDRWLADLDILSHPVDADVQYRRPSEPIFDATCETKRLLGHLHDKHLPGLETRLGTVGDSFPECQQGLLSRLPL